MPFVKNWKYSATVHSRRKRAVGMNSSVTKNCHYWHHYLLPHMNWRNGNKSPFIKRMVGVRVTDKTNEIFYIHNRIASHRRLHGRKGQYSTITEHMPKDHQEYLEWNGDRFRKWVKRIGINTCKVVEAILSSQRVVQQSYQNCMGLLKLQTSIPSTGWKVPAKRPLAI